MWCRDFPTLDPGLTERHKPLAVGDGQGWRFVGIEAIDLEFKIAHGK